MKGRKRISRRILRRFLSLAATTFAMGASPAMASSDSEALQPGSDDRDEYSRSGDREDDRAHAPYQHTFALPAPAARIPHRDTRAHLRVLDERGRKVAQLHLHGASMVGPFAPGAFTVLVKANGLTELHRIRIGVDTLPYLHFTETV